MAQILRFQGAQAAAMDLLQNTISESPPAALKYEMQFLLTSFTDNSQIGREDPLKGYRFVPTVRENVWMNDGLGTAFKLTDEFLDDRYKFTSWQSLLPLSAEKLVGQCSIKLCTETCRVIFDPMEKSWFCHTCSHRDQERPPRNKRMDVSVVGRISNQSKISPG